MELGIYESCLLRHLIADRLAVVDRKIRRYERFTEEHEIDVFYAKLSKLELERKTLSKIDALLSDHIGINYIE